MNGTYSLVVIPLAAFAVVLGLRYQNQSPGGAESAVSNDHGAQALAEAPVAEAYQALEEAESRHQQRFVEALDPAGADARLRSRVDDAARRDDPEELAALGFELFTRDFHGVERAQSAESTRCASCHHKGGPGGAGGLIDNFLDGRNPPALAGAGLIERLAREMTEELRAQARTGANRLRSKGVDFGSPSRPTGVAGDLMVRPFGRSGRWARLDEAIAEMGTRGVGAELSTAERRALESFVRSLPVAGIRPPDAARMPDLFDRFHRGRGVFTKIGCASCHVPTLRLNDGTEVMAFTDLKLHDLGENLADGKTRHWLTAPLWGVSTSAPWMHDGRALASLDFAIASHGGEAGAARTAYEELPMASQGDLKVFLLSLAPSPRMRVAGQ